MSLGIKQQPTDIMPVNNPVPIVYSSTFSTEDGFRYRVRLYNSGITTKEVETWIYPDTSNANYGIYDFSMILSDLISSNPNNYNKTGFTESWESFYQYNYDITEYIGSTSGATGTGSTYYTFRGVLQYGDTWDQSAYIPRTGVTGKFLSNKVNRKYRLTEYASINALYGDLKTYTSAYNRMVIDVYNGDTLIRYNFKNELGAGHIRGIYTFSIGPSQINTMADQGSIYTGATSDVSVGGAILDSTTVYYEVHLQNTNDIVSETKRIYLEHECFKHTAVEFLYLGDLSTFETFSFRMADVKSFKTSRNEIKTNQYTIKNDTYTYSIGDRGRKNVNIRTQESHSVISGWINDSEATDLMELFRSPEVYIIKSDGIHPIVLTNTGYVEKTIRNNTLFNYTIDYEMAYEKLSN